MGNLFNGHDQTSLLVACFVDCGKLFKRSMKSWNFCCCCLWRMEWNMKTYLTFAKETNLFVLFKLIYLHFASIFLNLNNLIMNQEEINFLFVLKNICQMFSLFSSWIKYSRYLNLFFFLNKLFFVICRIFVFLLSFKIFLDFEIKIII